MWYNGWWYTMHMLVAAEVVQAVGRVRAVEP